MTKLFALAALVSLAFLAAPAPGKCWTCYAAVCYSNANCDPTGMTGCWCLKHGSDQSGACVAGR